MRQVLFLLIIGISYFAQAEDTINLDQFLKQVRSENLDLKVESAAANAAQENAVGIALPPPMIGFGRTQDSSGTTQGYEVNQTIPFPTKMTNDHSARIQASENQTTIKKISEKEILAQARLNYFYLWQAQEKLTLLIEKKNAIKEHIKLATAGARSDSFLKIHLIKTESDLDLLENDISMAEQIHREKQIEIAEMLNLSSSVFRPLAIAPKITPLPQEDTFKNPLQIKSAQLQLEGLKYREQEAKSSWFPDFNLRYKEMSGAMTPRYTESMIGITLPFLFFWEPNSASKKASFERLQAELKLQQEKNKVESKLAKLFSKAQSLKKQLDQISNNLLPRAEKRMHLVHNLAPRDMETLQDHRETIEAFPELKIKALDLRTQYEEVVAELQKYSSEDLN